MKKYIKPEFEIKSLTVNENISTLLTDWLDQNYIEADVGITTYYLESM